MSFTPKILQITPGSLNLLPPGDKVGEHDFLYGLGFQIDRAGSLVSMRDSSSIGFFPFGGGGILRVRKEFGVFYAQSGTTLYRGSNGGSIIKNGITGGRFGFASYQGRVWIMNESGPVKDTGSGAPLAWTTPTPSTPGASGSSGGSLTGSRTYYVTFSTALDEESNPSNAVTVTSLSNSKVTVTLPGGADASVTKWNVYRADGGLTAPYRVNSSPIAIGTGSYVDYGDVGHSQDDDSVARLGLALEVDHDPAPNAHGLAGPYFERLLAWKDDKLWWTPTSRPWYFRGSGTADGDWVQVGMAGEKIIAVIIHPRTAHIFKENSIWRLNGDPDTGTLELITPNYGLIGEEAWAQTPMGDAFQTANGIYLFNGDTVKEISPQLRPIFRGESVKVTPSLTIRPADKTQFANNAMGYRLGKLYYSYQVSSAVTLALICDLESGRWTFGPGGVNAYCDEGQTGYLVTGDGTSMLGRMESSAHNSYPVSFYSRYYNFNLPENDKTFIDLVMEANTQGTSLTVNAYFNGGDTTTPLGIMNTSALAQHTFQFPEATNRARSVAIGFYGQTQTGPLIVARMLLHYYVHPRLAQTFDTQATDLGDPRVKTIDDLEFDIDTQSACAVTLYGALPGDQLAVKYTGTIAAAAARRKVRMMIPKPFVDALLLRLVVTGAGFNLYGARIRARGIGEYIVGATGDVWAPLEVSLGV